MDYVIGNIQQLEEKIDTLIKDKERLENQIEKLERISSQFDDHAIFDLGCVHYSRAITSADQELYHAIHCLRQEVEKIESEVAKLENARDVLIEED